MEKPYHSSAQFSDEELRELLTISQVNIKSVHPSDEDSEIYRAIKTDDYERLEHDWTLGEFLTDLRTPNAKLLQARANNGLQDIAHLCVDLNASRCMLFLLEWSKPSTIPYDIDKKVLWNYAKEKALGPEEKLSCLVELMEAKIIDEDLQTLALKVFPRVKSAEYAKRLHEIMIQDDHRHTADALIEVSGQRYTQPDVIATLISLARRRRESIDKISHGQEGGRGGARTALSEACHSLNVDAIRLLLENGSDPRIGTHNGFYTSSGYNPLFRLLAQEFHLPLPANPPDDSCGCKKVEHPDDEGLYMAIKETASRMVDSLYLMYYEGFPNVHDVSYMVNDDFINMYYRAVDIYGETLRNLLIAKIRRHLPPKIQKTLIEEKHEPTRSPYLPRETPPTTATQYKFLDTLNGTQLEKILEEFGLGFEYPFILVWTVLMTPENVDLLKMFLKDTTIHEPRLQDTNTTKLLYECLLDPKSRPLPPTVNSELEPDECDCLDDFLDEYEPENTGK